MRRFRSPPRFTAAPDSADIKSNSTVYLSLSLLLSWSPLAPSVFVFSSNPVSILHRSFASPPSRRLLHCAFALEVISKNFWRWIVPRDGNRRPTLPAAFTQTTGETTFPSVRATALRLTISERNNIQNSRDSRAATKKRIASAVSPSRTNEILGYLTTRRRRW